MRPLTCLLPVLSAFVAMGTMGPVNAAETPEPAALTFAQQCATCHTIGGGRKVGPDLLGVTQRRDKAWFSTFVKNPSAVIDGGDPVANELLKEYGVRMPALGLQDSDVDGLWAYLAACTDKGGCQPVALGPKWGTDGTPEEIAAGRALFFGESRFQKGGAPCFVCHNVRSAGLMGGGSMGPDLTFAYARLGERELDPLLGEMSSPVMAAVYAQTPLTEDERFALKAYFADLARNGSLPREQSEFFWLGLEGMALALGGFVIVWGRNKAKRRESQTPTPSSGPRSEDAQS